MVKKSFYILLIISLFFIICCEPKKPRDAKLTIVGDMSWFEPYKSNVEFESYLLKKCTVDSEYLSIDWPPKGLRRKVDISVDVTGSCYNTKVTYNNEIISLAEYNLLSLCKRLKSGNLLQPGDKVTLRLFGSNYGKSQASGREFENIEIPPNVIEAEVSILTRRYNDLKLTVRKVRSAREALLKKIDEIKKWFMPYINRSEKKDERYKESPFLEHINRVFEENSSALLTRRVFIFVTDGWFQTGNPHRKIYFNPSSFARDRSLGKKTMDFIKKSNLNSVITKNQKKAQVDIMGLNDGHNPEFGKAQRDLFEWLFQNHDVSILDY